MSARKRASRAGSGSGEVTISEARPLWSPRRARNPRAAAIAEPVDHSRERPKEAGQLAEHVHTGDAREDREHERCARARTRGQSGRRALRNTCRALPSRKPSSRFGASRKSSALREGGVSSTITSKSCSSCSSYSLAIALRSCEPATAVESSRYTGLARISARACSSGSRRVIKLANGCAWRRASSPTARPLQATPCSAIKAGSICGSGSDGSSARPSADARRRAGSIVTTATFCPR